MPNEKPQRGDSILFFDLETLPCSPDNSLWQRLKSEDADRKRTALMSPLGRVWMIGWAVGSGEPQIAAGDGSPDSEEAVLREFWEAIQGLQNPWWVGYNIEGFDIPFLQVRALKWGMPELARKLGVASAKPWERRQVDLAKIWPRTGADRYSWREGVRGLGKLDTICDVLGIPRQEGLMGKDVAEAWDLGNHEGVAEHLRLDVVQVKALFRELWPLL
jgi:uncharacterized protein YprB with RNaseH-like and TPR domain